MKLAEKIYYMQSIVEDISDNIASVYLNLAGNKIIDRLYPFDDTKTIDDIPTRYDTLHCELASRMYLRRGADGEISHNENGINRTYGSVDDSDLLDKIMPYAKV